MYIPTRKSMNLYEVVLIWPPQEYSFCCNAITLNGYHSQKLQCQVWAITYSDAWRFLARWKHVFRSIAVIFDGYHPQIRLCPVPYQGLNTGFQIFWCTINSSFPGAYVWFTSNDISSYHPQQNDVRCHYDGLSMGSEIFWCTVISSSLRPCIWLKYDDIW